MTGSSRCVRLLSVLCAALLVVSVQPAAARSNGILSSCDLTPQVWPKAGTIGSQLWPNGKFGKNFTSDKPGGLDSGIMRWVTAPVPTDFYTLRAGDSSSRSRDQKTYTPGGELVELHLRVADLQRRYIGLVLYATNGTNGGTSEVAVGSWTLIPGDTNFQTSATWCGGNSKIITHTGANLKPLHTRFYWSAPRGTGAVQFRVLIKQGEQNKGSFFWPIVPLTLREGPAPPAPVVPTPTPAPSNSSANGTVPSPEPVKPKFFPDVPLANATILGRAGLACADACYANNPATPFCDRAAIEKISTPAALASAVQGRAACQLPVLSACPYAGAARVSDKGFCSFRASDLSACPASLRSLNGSAAAPGAPVLMPDVCFTAPAAGARALCVCSNDRAVQPANPFAPTKNGGGASSRSARAEARAARAAAQSVDGQDDAAAPRAQSASSNILLACFGALVAIFSCSSNSVAGSPTRSLAFSVVVLALVALVAPAPAAAHNYIKSQHRAQEAAVSRPCQARLGNQPHVQVARKQPFEIEWSNGHGESKLPVWFVVLHESNYNELLADNLTAIIADYLSLAPASAYLNNSVDSSGRSLAYLWDKQHVRLANDPTNPKYFLEEGSASVPTTDPAFIQREWTYMSKAHPTRFHERASKANPVIQQRLKPEFNKPDQRVNYKSAKYPWIESVHRFPIPFSGTDLVPTSTGEKTDHEIFFDQSSIIRMSIEARSGPGDYVIFFYWAGYKDCIDVNIVSSTTPVLNRYGLNATAAAPTVIKQDHCEFTNIPSAQTLLRKLGPNRDASQCIADCKKNAWCTAVQVVRAFNPPTALPYTVNIPWIPRFVNETLSDLGIYDPCAALTVHERTTRGCLQPPTNNAIPSNYNLTKDDFVCFGVRPSRNQDNQVEEDWTIATEPEDPVFYSTCFSLVPAGGFLDVPPLVQQEVPWATGDACLACDFHDALRQLNDSQVPHWAQGVAQPGRPCQDCSVANSDWSVSAARAQLAGENRPYAGVDPATGEPIVPPAEPSKDGGGGSGSSGVDAILDNKLYLGLVIAAIAVALLGLGAGTWFGLRQCRNRTSSADSDLAKMQRAAGNETSGAELTSNPVAGAQW